MRKPRVENKYNLKPKDIQKAVVLDFERLHTTPFWRNNVVNAWCLSETTIKTGKMMNMAATMNTGLASMTRMQKLTQEK